jgi:heme exporter protein A
MIKVKHLVKRYGHKTILNGLAFDVREGEFVGLLGPNGAGKTTFLRILASLARPDEGQVWIAGHPIPARAARVRRQLGFVSHQPLLYDDLTALENLVFYGRMYNLEHYPERAETVLEQVGLYTRRLELVRTFSRGMRQRLAIGRAMLHDPRVILFDEPHTGLDQDASEMLDRVLVDVAARGRTVVITSHDLARVADLAGRYDVLSRGVIAASANREEIGPENLFQFYRQVVSEQLPDGGQR